MRKFIFFAFVICVCATNAQEFKLTNTYDVTNQRTVGQEEEDTWAVDVIETKNPEKTIATLNITDFGLLDEIRISVLQEPEYAYEPISDIHYIFPNQSFGKEGTILRAALQYTEKYTIKDIKVLRSIAWNDDDFDTEDAITAIN